MYSISVGMVLTKFRLDATNHIQEPSQTRNFLDLVHLRARLKFDKAFKSRPRETIISLHLHKIFSDLFINLVLLFYAPFNSITTTSHKAKSCQCSSSKYQICHRHQSKNIAALTTAQRCQRHRDRYSCPCPQEAAVRTRRQRVIILLIITDGTTGADKGVLLEIRKRDHTICRRMYRRLMINP